MKKLSETALEIKCVILKRGGVHHQAEMEQEELSQFYAQPYKDGQWEKVLVELNQEKLVVKRRDLVHEDIMSNYEIIDEKYVTLQKNENSKLGFTIMGGIDFKCPIKIYKIDEGSPAQMCGELEQYDAILEINGISMWGLSHDEAVATISDQTGNVTLHSGKFKEREFEEQIPMVWFTMVTVPLQMASITKYQAGTSILRPNGFEVMSRDGSPMVCLRCEDAPERWISTINRYISTHTMQEMEHYNNNLERNEQILHMGWVYEQLPSTTHTHVWRRKFLVLKQLYIQIFDTVPDTVDEWERPEERYKLLEMTIKVLESHTLPDQRANSLILTSGTGTNHIICCETEESILRWTSMIHQATVEAVQSTGRVAYSARWKDRDAVFILDIDQGLLLHSKNDPSNIFWKKPFSYLRHSSDDGHSKMKLKCAIEQSRITEVHDVELDDLQLAICSLECFMVTKVAMLDPAFIKQHTDIIAN